MIFPKIIYIWLSFKLKTTDQVVEIIIALCQHEWLYSCMWYYEIENPSILGIHFLFINVRIC